MTSKIEFYREVLSDDPNSRVFFPLATMLAGGGAPAEAVEVLTRCIPLHPAHLEAKFLLVELLSGLGRHDEAEKAFEALTPLLSGYPSVWTLWAAKAPGLSRDAALALRFLALTLGGGPGGGGPGGGGPGGGEVTLASIMEKGLAAAGAPGASNAASQGPAFGARADSENGQATEAGETFTLRGADEVLALAREIEARDRRAPAGELPPECASAVTAEVKTRTMADLLARHGDYTSSLEIYGELLRMATTTQEKQTLSSRITEIESLMATGAAPRQQEPLRETKSKAKLVSMLEALANRLDARATA